MFKQYNNENNNKCKKKRTIFDLFEIYNCNNCSKLKEDEFIRIGNRIIAIYYLFNECDFLGIKTEDLVYNSKKLKILLKDAIINDDKIILLFINNLEMEKYFNIFERILDNDLDIQIITINDNMS